MAVSSELWDVEAAVHTPFSRLELRHYHFPMPGEVIEEEDRPILSLTLPRACEEDGKGRFQDGARQPQVLKPLLFRPPMVPLHAFGKGGRARILICEFEKKHFEASTGLSDWGGSRLRRCLDLNNNAIASAMRSILREMQAPGFGSAMLVESTSVQMMVLLARAFLSQPRGEADRGQLADWQLRRIREILHEVETCWPSVATLAVACGISRCHLSRSFALTVGQPLSEYSRAIRISRAKALILRGQHSVSDIAYQLGFSGAASFSTAFRNDVGLSPSKFVRFTDADGGSPNDRGAASLGPSQSPLHPHSGRTRCKTSSPSCTL